MDVTSERLRGLSDRADRAGYRLLRDRTRPETWMLVDAEDGTPVHAAASLDRIELWLDR
ncbi:hypothetical protein AB0L57_05780 [Nocardia sp. NPDC052254]|uniref:hypothetical protein n=1 Tax=Nocardia sp. NPDC052254 TaxID=3155681 RepID=UPI0034377F97